MKQIRRSGDRGHVNHGWLESYHSFSFASYHDQDHMNFGDLRVINEDWISPGGGFPMHPHKNMEIITYIVSGELEHKDSMGNGSIIRPGDIQRMSAGSGITHSEFNHSPQNPVHLLQIWIDTCTKDIAPGYEQKNYTEFQDHSGLTLIASMGGRLDSVHINQDVNVFSGNWNAGQGAQIDILQGRRLWIQLINGSLEMGDVSLESGDGVAVSDEVAVSLMANSESEFLLFDLN
jgi:redox-sensitive bicupin YhaK (pirin superfamily)